MKLWSATVFCARERFAWQAVCVGVFVELERSGTTFGEKP